MNDLDTDELLDRVAKGDASVVDSLFDRHRKRLRQMIAVHLDRRILPRTDASDVVQETLLEAHQRLPQYVRDRRVPFYVWLRQLAWQKVVDEHRRHLRSKRRSVVREEDLEASVNRQSAARLAEILAAQTPAPSESAARRELCQQMTAALDQLTSDDREVLLLRLVEKLSLRETAAVLNVAEGTVSSRQFRALRRLEALLAGPH